MFSLRSKKLRVKRAGLKPSPFNCLFDIFFSVDSFRRLLRNNLDEEQPKGQQLDLDSHHRVHISNFVTSQSDT